MNPEFLTNEPNVEPPKSIHQDVSGLLAHYTSHSAVAPGLDIATAYFNLGGYELLAQALDGVGKVRLLLGSEPSDFAVRSTITSLDVRRARRGDPRRTEALDRHLDALREDRDLVGFGETQSSAVERLITWLRRGDVEVRRLEKGFLHGKAFIVEGAQHAAIAGSANFTRAGLSLNAELELGVYTPSVVTSVRSWFDTQWDAATPFDLAGLYEARRVPHNPWQVFLRMLLEQYGDDLLEDTRTDNELGLAQFQVDGVWRAKRILSRYRGVIVADEVGLGKTYVAGELIREAAIERRQKVLVVAPATLRDGTWRPFLTSNNLPADVVSYEELTRDLERAGTAGASFQALDSYAMVVVDEAHNLRNSSTQRADALRELLGGRVAKDVILLSATPVNNSLSDLQTLISYITPSDSQFADIGVPSLKDYIASAQALSVDELSSHHLFEVLDAIAVRRTRTFIKEQYPNAQVNGKPIVFPQVRPHRVDHDLTGVLPGLLDDFAVALGVDVPDSAVAAGDIAPRNAGASLTMARYVPSRYRLGHELEQYQVQNAGLLQSALLKRFESSTLAFSNTLGTMINSHNAFLRALEGGWVLTGDALREWVSSESDDVEDLVRSLDDEARDRAESAGDYDVAALRAAVTADREILASLRTAVEHVTWRNDPKIVALTETLAAIAQDAERLGVGEQDTGDRRKVLLFTYYADTAHHIETALLNLTATDPRLAGYRDRIVVATGADRHERQEAILGFAPRTAGTLDEDGEPTSEDRFDIAVATDVLAEGVNLQQAGRIINYDLPWNPMRLVQRHGRIDRIGSPHAYIDLHSFFPSKDLDRLLALEERLTKKLHLAAAAFGTSTVLPGIEAVERVLSERSAEIQRIRQEDASFFDDASATASSEEFQRRLVRAFEGSVRTKDAVQHLPFGAGTGIRRARSVDGSGRAGVVFCVKVADHPRPFFRYLPFDTVTGTDGAVHYEPMRETNAEGEQVVVLDSSLLTGLIHADPKDPLTEPELPEALHAAVLAAWTHAQQDVHADWQRRTDPRTYQPALPKVMRDAASLVRDHGSHIPQQELLIERLQQNVPVRHQTQVRAVLAAHEGSPTAAISALQALADDLRLTKPPAPPSYPEVEIEDVRLLAWVAEFTT